MQNVQCKMFNGIASRHFAFCICDTKGRSEFVIECPTESFSSLATALAPK
jgi:hypothetical protein